MNPLSEHLIVERKIPNNVIDGLRAGRYNLHGGVLRGAPGTEEAGRIICHLLPTSPDNLWPGPVSGPIKPSPIPLPGEVFNLAVAAASFGLLNLAATSVGFFMLNRKLNHIEKELKEIKGEVQKNRDEIRENRQHIIQNRAEIRENREAVERVQKLLERREHARMRVALQDLERIEKADAPKNRNNLLHGSRRTLAEVQSKYESLLGRNRQEH